jgi:hypothetical protein
VSSSARNCACRSLYLDLLKKSVSGTLFEPNAENPNSALYISKFIDHYINGNAVTMLPVRRLDNLHACVKEILFEGIPGDLIETGVWRGGATIFMRGILKAYDDKERTVWVADSFEGLPEPDVDKFPKEAAVGPAPIQWTVFS